MDESITFHVVGTPTPKGSFTRMPNGAMLPAGTSASRKRADSWRRDIKDAALTAMGERQPSRKAIRLMVDFRLSYPVTVIRKYQMGWLPHTKQPDVDKLLRMLMDALTGIIWADDAQVCYVMLNKSYAWDGQPGAYVVVDFMEDESLKQVAQAQRQLMNALGGP